MLFAENQTFWPPNFWAGYATGLNRSQFPLELMKLRGRLLVGHVDEAA